ncbi:hypothetical protein PV721_21565 [Streptomyces sp. MB09-01]|uniref:hypothetical protein n=1 Tax=Streptomyces sp. MB09-01 TaxID=3028666 RepID=UPI0029BBC866|nr:hypothetical protein [Streptomyces sp. MB09-01]MDX3536916.1 hypothetical protein [Streptomyces sp. MB09-01]
MRLLGLEALRPGEREAGDDHRPPRAAGDQLPRAPRRLERRRPNTGKARTPGTFTFTFGAAPAAAGADGKAVWFRATATGVDATPRPVARPHVNQQGRPLRSAGPAR